MSNIFNESKTVDQYQNESSLFLGEAPGLFDTINKHHPKIWALYKEMKSLDWDEKEFDYSQLNSDFKNCPKSTYSMMIKTLAWQWEADSIASRSVLPLLAPFITDTSYWSAEQRVSDNENVHAATYSEIVRMSFDDPKKVLEEILAVKESFQRLKTVKTVFEELNRSSHLYALGQISKEEAYPIALLAVVTIYMLERIQFMSSFAITFTICSTGMFQSIGKAVQKIAQDELEVHVELRKEVIRTELKTQRGLETYAKLLPRIEEIFSEIVNSELTWNKYIFSEGRELLGANLHTINAWALYNAADPYTFLGLTTDEFKFPRKNPMPFLEDWIDITKTQAAPQEQDNNQYKVGVIVRDDSEVSFDVDF